MRKVRGNNPNKELETRLQESGVMNNLQAHYVSDVGCLVSQEISHPLFEFKSQPKSLAEQIAASLVIKYLEDRKMNFSITCAKVESKETLFTKIENIAEKLELPADKIDLLRIVIKTRTLTPEQLEAKYGINQKPLETPLKYGGFWIPASIAGEKFDGDVTFSLLKRALQIDQEIPGINMKAFVPKKVRYTLEDQFAKPSPTSSPQSPKQRHYHHTEQGSPVHEALANLEEEEDIVDNVSCKTDTENQNDKNQNDDNQNDKIDIDLEDDPLDQLIDHIDTVPVGQSRFAKRTVIPSDRIVYSVRPPPKKAEKKRLLPPGEEEIIEEIIEEEEIFEEEELPEFSTLRERERSRASHRTPSPKARSVKSQKSVSGEEAEIPEQFSPNRSIDRSQESRSPDRSLDRSQERSPKGIPRPAKKGPAKPKHRRAKSPTASGKRPGVEEPEREAEEEQSYEQVSEEPAEVENPPGTFYTYSSEGEPIERSVDINLEEGESQELKATKAKQPRQNALHFDLPSIPQFAQSSDESEEEEGDFSMAAGADGSLAPTKVYGKLRVTVLEGEGMRFSHGKNCMLFWQLCLKSAPAHHQETRALEGPRFEWKEHFTFTTESRNRDILAIELILYNEEAKRQLGRVNVPLAALVLGRKISKWYPVEGERLSDKTKVHLLLELNDWDGKSVDNLEQEVGDELEIPTTRGPEEEDLPEFTHDVSESDEDDDVTPVSVTEDADISFSTIADDEL